MVAGRKDANVDRSAQSPRSLESDSCQCSEEYRPERRGDLLPGRRPARSCGAFLECADSIDGDNITTRGGQEAYSVRARTFARFGNVQAALSDLDRAERAAVSLEDQKLRTANIAQVNILRAELFQQASRPVESLGAAQSALDYYAKTGETLRQAELLALQAKGREALGDIPGAERDYHAATEAFERSLAALASPEDRVQAFERQRSAIRQLVRFEETVRGNHAEALRIAERGRASALAGRWGIGIEDPPLNPTDAHRRIPDDAAVVYYTALNDRILVAVLTKEGVHHFERPMALTSLRGTIKTLARLIAEDATVQMLARAGSPLSDALIEPALQGIPSKHTVVFVPDDWLSAVPFAALPRRDGRPLIATHTVLVAPSFTTFVIASTRLADLKAADVLAIGDGHDVEMSGLP